MTDKQCRICGRWLPVEVFPLRRDRHGRAYRSSPCRQCTNMGIWICRNRDKEARNAENRAYYQEHRVAILAQKAAAYRANVEAKKRYEKRRRMRRALARLEQAMTGKQDYQERES